MYVCVYTHVVLESMHTGICSADGNQGWETMLAVVPLDKQKSPVILDMTSLQALGKMCV